MTQGAREEALALMDKRDRVEAEMRAIVEQLEAPGGPGLTGNLVDREGFPRAEIDIPAIRAQRHRLAVLQTDFRILSTQVEEKLHAAFAERAYLVDSNRSAQQRGAGGGTTPQKRTEPTIAEEARPAAPTSGLTTTTASTIVTSTGLTANGRAASAQLQPFAVVDEISAGSPAAEDGLMVGDQVVQFGGVSGAGPDVLQRVAAEMQGCQGLPVEAELLRGGQQVKVTVTPRRWGGRGLLGCHLQPL